MKKIIKLGIFTLMIALISSCSKWIDPNINIDPDAPSEVTMELLVPSIEANLAYAVVGGNDVTRPQAMWMQQLTGIARQSEAQGRYLFRSNNVSNLWSSIYASVGMDATQLIKQAADKASPHVAGVAKVLLALDLGMATDMWGDIPYSEAFNGKDNLTPAFESQENIYKSIGALLDGAISDLSSSDNAVDIGGDFIYGGSTQDWINAANALKARYFIHLSELDANTAYAAALAAANTALDGGFSDMKFDWATSETGANPLYQFMRDRGDVVMGSTLIDMLNESNDPRLPALATFADDTTIYIGSTMTALDATASKPGPAVASNESPTFFMMKAEVYFIKAEAEMGTDEAAAKADIKNAMNASMASYGVDPGTWVDDYYTANIDTKSGADLKKELFKQKYIALFYQQEVWTDFRRTNNILGLTPNPNADKDFPARYPYAQSSIDYNPNTPDFGTITNKLWWDQ
ncbi:MAG TPA: SusD/RagB family nutrient-binding outer membrane lipoprotein [Bacteroidetes bacterium]|nr:SusD/RagB family nutrient-binding outer membrane lipoprotein [Bacteroidota bacterium]